MDKNQCLAVVTGAYGLLVLAGGAIGWVKARSLPSLISGVIFGLGLLVCGFGILALDRHQSVCAAGFLALFLLIAMGIRFAKTKKFMPAGLVAVLSLVMVVVFFSAR